MKNIVTVYLIFLLCALNLLAHSSAQGSVRTSSVQGSRPDSAPVTLRLDYAGAEALLDALEKDSLSDTEVNGLLHVAGLSAMIHNVTRFVPEVGVPEYEMAKALERYCGRKCIGSLFEKPPVEFFRSYIALYRKHPEIRGRFSRETETFINAYGRRP